MVVVMICGRSKLSERMRAAWPSSTSSATEPVADNKTAEGRAKNRRVTVEVVGSRGTAK